MQTRNQEIAVDAFQNVKDVAPSLRSEYKSMAKRFPSLVQSAGLAQALSFVEARGTDAQKLLLKNISSTVRKVRRYQQWEENESLSEFSRNTQSLQEYINLTRQVLATLVWYKRFASSVFSEEETE